MMKAWRSNASASRPSTASPSCCVIETVKLSGSWLPSAAAPELAAACRRRRDMRAILAHAPPPCNRRSRRQPSARVSGPRRSARPRRRRSRRRGSPSARCRPSRAGGSRASAGRSRTATSRPDGERHLLRLEVDGRLGRRSVEQLAHVASSAAPRRAGRSWRSWSGRCRRTMARRSRGSPSPAAPTARARATSRSRSSAPATRIGACRNSRLVEDEVGLVLAPVEEQELAEAGALDALQELLRDDLVGVDVGAVERRDGGRSGGRTAPSVPAPVATSTRWPGDRGRGGHLRATPGGCGRRGPGGPRSCGSTSTRSARRAAGCRGSCRGTSSSRRSRHSKPASVKTRSRPSRSACGFTSLEPGTTIARHASATRCALDDAGGGAQVLDAAVRARADEDAVDRDVLDRRAGLERHVAAARAPRRRSSAARGTRP